MTRRWTDDQVVEARILYREGVSMKEIKARFGGSSIAVDRMLHGITYFDIPGWQTKGERLVNGGRWS